MPEISDIQTLLAENRALRITNEQELDAYLQTRVYALWLAHGVLELRFSGYLKEFVRGTASDISSSRKSNGPLLIVHWDGQARKERSRFPPENLGTTLTNPNRIVVESLEGITFIDRRPLKVREEYPLPQYGAETEKISGSTAP